MSNIVEQSILNNFTESIDQAITAVGGNTQDIHCMCDYPKVIRQQLVKALANVDFDGGDGVTIDKNEGSVYTISANSGATLLKDLVYKDITIPSGTSIQNTFDTLFKRILSSIPSVLGGDLITADEKGRDIYPKHKKCSCGCDDCTCNASEAINEEGVKTGLIPDSKYLRLFVEYKDEPIYISLQELMDFQDAPKDGKKYARKDGEWTETEVITDQIIQGNTNIPEGTPHQDVFEYLFKQVLPSIPSIIKGDVILSSKEGTDTYAHPKDPTPNTKTGLDPQNHYMRIFIESQIEPIYISCEPIALKGGETRDASVAVIDNTIYVNMHEVPEKAVDNMIDTRKVEKVEAKAIFDNIFK